MGFGPIALRLRQLRKHKVPRVSTITVVEKPGCGRTRSVTPWPGWSCGEAVLLREGAQSLNRKFE